MKAITLLTAAALMLSANAFAADQAPKANAAHSTMKKKLAQCQANAAAQTPALNKEDAKKFVQDCVAKKA
jgi:uncharacterized protein YycO